MPVFTVSQIINRAAAAADMHDEFVSFEQWLAWLNVERANLQMFIVRHGMPMQNLQVETLLQPDRVALQQDAVALVGVWETRGGRFRQIQIRDFPGNFFQNTGGPSTGPAQFVTVEDANTASTSQMFLRFFPRDPVGTYIAVYAQAPPVLTALTDAMSFPMGMEELMVLKMAKKALVKEESDTEAIDKLITQQEKFIEEFVAARVLTNSGAVKNTDGLERDSWVFEPLYPEVNRWIFF